MSNDDLRHTSDDAAHAHSSDAWDDLSQLDIPALPDFGDLPGFADLPELAPLPELDALQEPAMPEIVMPDLEMPDLDQFLTVTPPAPADVPQPDVAPTTGAGAAAGPTAAQTSSARHGLAEEEDHRQASTEAKRHHGLAEEAARSHAGTAADHYLRAHAREDPASLGAPEAEKAEPPHRVRRSHRDRLGRVVSLVHSRRFIVDTLGHADLVERQHTGGLRGARTCGGSADPLPRIPRERHEHAFHVAAVGVGRGHRVDA